MESIKKDFMEIEEIHIKDIKPSRYNPRQISNEEYNKLSRSINEFGIVDPIIINLKNNHIIGGHQRYEVMLDEYKADNTEYATLKLIKLGDIGWVFPTTDLKINSDQHEKALNIALNKISGEWDNEKLELLFHDLSVDGFDLTISGFDKLEIKNLFSDVELNTKKYDNDDFYEDLLNDSLENSTGNSSGGGGGNTGSTTTSKDSLYPKIRVCPECGHKFYDE